MKDRRECSPPIFARFGPALWIGLTQIADRKRFVIVGVFELARHLAEPGRGVLRDLFARHAAPAAILLHLARTGAAPFGFQRREAPSFRQRADRQVPAAVG